MNVTGAVADHGGLGGLADDDHTQYLLASGGRDVAGILQPDGDATRDLGSSSRHYDNAYADTLTLKSGQIVFPATQIASAGANTLDDYEENTWTPGISFGGGTTGITYTTQVGHYTKVGNTVMVWGRVTLSSNGSSTGSARITGLPFATANISNLYPVATIGYYVNLLFITGALYAYSDPNVSTINLTKDNAAGGTTPLTEANFGDTADLIFSMTYRV
jgi:hypothetical protein